MEPQAAPTSPERAPAPALTPEQGVPNVEQSPAPTPERVAPPTERPGSGAPPAPLLPLPTPPLSVVSPADSTLDRPLASLSRGSPAIADDVDVIEKAWVQKAKTIVNDHKHDPYTQEKETSKLQADYLKKRYGKEVKVNE